MIIASPAAVPALTVTVVGVPVVPSAFASMVKLLPTVATVTPTALNLCEATTVVLLPRAVTLRPVTAEISFVTSN